MIKIYDTYTDSLKISKAAHKEWWASYQALRKYMSYDFRTEYLGEVTCRVYLNDSDLVIESEVRDGVVTEGKEFDSHYEVMTVALCDAKRYRL